MAKKPASTEPEQTVEQPVIDDGKTDYEIQPNPPRFIALQLVREGQATIRLTEAEARAEVLAGHIRLAAQTSAEDGSTDV